MMLVRLGHSDEITASFKDPSFNPTLQPFAAMTPEDALLESSLVDPGLAAPLGLNAQQLAVASAEMGMRSLLHQQQYIVYDLASHVGVLSPFVSATQKALQGFDIILHSLNQDAALEEVVTTAIGVVGETLSAIPTIYTQITGNLINLGVWMANRFLQYQAPLPPQEPALAYSKATDEQQFNGSVAFPGVRGAMTGSYDWTSIFSPRFSGALSAQVLEDRFGRLVLAFALGDGDIPRVDVKGKGENRQVVYPDEGSFAATGGLGMVPGGERILSVVQVTPTEVPVGPSSGHATIYDPRCGSIDKARAIDVGSWYPVTAQGALSLWDFIWKRGAAMYTINCPAAQKAWGDYFQSIWMGVVRTWGSRSWMGRSDQYGWGCGFWENALQELVRQYTIGINGRVGGALAWAPPNITSQDQGPLTLDKERAWEDANAFDRIIDPALSQLAYAQKWYLENTTIAAYLPIMGGANANPLDQGTRGPMGAMRSLELREAFGKARHRILNGPDKYDVRLRDVLDPVYRQEIEAHGGGTHALELGFTAKVRGAPEPFEPEGGSGTPTTIVPEALLPPDRPKKPRSGAPYILGGVATLGATALSYYHWDRLVRASAAVRERLPKRLR